MTRTVLAGITGFAVTAVGVIATTWAAALMLPAGAPGAIPVPAPSSLALGSVLSVLSVLSTQRLLIALSRGAPG